MATKTGTAFKMNVPATVAMKATRSLEEMLDSIYEVGKNGSPNKSPTKKEACSLVDRAVRPRGSLPAGLSPTNRGGDTFSFLSYDATMRSFRWDSVMGSGCLQRPGILSEEHNCLVIYQ